MSLADWLHILSNIRHGDFNMRDLAFDDAMEDLMLLAICLLLVDCDRCLNFKDFKPLMRVVKVVIFPGLENIRARKSKGLPGSWHWWRPLPWESQCVLYFWICDSTTAFVNFISGWYRDQIELIAIPAASWQHLNQLKRGLTASKTRHYLCWLDVCSLSVVQGFGAGDSKWRFHGHGIFHWLHPFWVLLQPGAGAWNHPCGYRRDHVKCSSCHCNFTVVFLALQMFYISGLCKIQWLNLEGLLFTSFFSCTLPLAVFHIFPIVSAQRVKDLGIQLLYHRALPVTRPYVSLCHAVIRCHFFIMLSHLLTSRDLNLNLWGTGVATWPLSTDWVVFEAQTNKSNTNLTSITAESGFERFGMEVMMCSVIFPHIQLFLDVQPKWLVLRW